MGEKIVVAMSGGVDSSTAAMLLAEQGYEVHGLFMRTGVEARDAGRRTCCSMADAQDARRVAAKMGISFHLLNFERGFGKVIEDFVEAYRQGRTPNPCIVCNDVLKFGQLIHYADALGAGSVATGHYARVEKSGERCRLRRGADGDKDQSYVLFALSQEQLSRAVFPLGGMKKDEVRRLARDGGLPVSEKQESQDICFVPSGDYRDLLREKGVTLSPGKIVDSAGKVLGEHKGIEHFTVGQRRGLGGGFAEPQYVIEVRAETREVVIGPSEELYRKRFRTGPVNWISRSATRDAFRAEVQIRYQHKAASACVEADREGCATVTFEGPQRAITPGQAAVFYEGEYVAAGGWIEAVCADR